MEIIVQRKPYQPPQITRVALRREQAILSACSTTTGDLTNSSNRGCRTTCRRSNSATGRDSASPAS